MYVRHFPFQLPSFGKKYLNDEGDGWYADGSHELKYVVAHTWNIELEINFHRIAEKLQEIGHIKAQKSSRKAYKEDVIGIELKASIEKVSNSFYGDHA